MKWSVVLARWFDPAIVKLALRNVFRQRGRTLLTLSVIGSGVAGLILSGGFVEDALDKLRESTIHAQLGHLQVYRTGYHEFGKRSPFDYLIDKPESIGEFARTLPQVVNTMDRLSFAGVLNNGRSDFAILGEGIEPAKEARLGTQIQIVEGRALRPEDHFGIMVGEGVASGSELKPGSVVNLLLNTRDGALNTLEFTVVGVFRTFSSDYDARAVRIALPDAQDLLASKAVNAVVIELAKTSDTDAVAARLRETLDPQQFEVVPWIRLADYYEKTAKLFEQQFFFMQAIILLAVLLSVANSVNMTIFERTGEFGTLQAVGTRQGTIFRLVLFENLFVGLMGSMLGVVLGLTIGEIINFAHIEMPPPPNSNSGYYAGIQLRASLVAIAFAVGFLATPITALLPARRIARVPVVDALRAN